MEQKRNQTLPSLAELKSRARDLRYRKSDTGIEMSHSASLESVAHTLGFRNWNALHAAAPRWDETYVPGARVCGTYLGHQYSGTVLKLTHADDSDWRHITVSFDAPIDVVRFDSFSAFRSRVNAVIDRRGRTPTCTSDGNPHLTIALQAKSEIRQNQTA